MIDIGCSEAENALSAWLDAERGEEFVISRRVERVAKLMPLRDARGTERARLAAQRIRDLAEVMNLGRFNWQEWKMHRDEGRL